MHIYKITNLVNGKIYVGQTVQKNPKMRWYAHLDYARNGKKSHLYNSIRKYGTENFKWEILEAATSLDELNTLETKWEKYYKARGFILYNNRGTGNNKLHSKESKEKMSRVQKEAHARRRAEGRNSFTKTKKTSGWTHSDESKANRKEWAAKLNKERCQGKTWKLVNGKRVWLEKEAAV